MGAIQDEIEADYDRQYWEERKARETKIWARVLTDLHQFKLPGNRIFDAKFHELRDYAMARLYENS